MNIEKTTKTIREFMWQIGLRSSSSREDIEKDISEVLKKHFRYQFSDENDISIKINDDGITVSQTLSKIKQAVEGATSKQLFETCNDLASNPELRIRVEKEIQDTLPEGTTFRINECGFGEMHLPLHIAGKIITEDPEAKEGVKNDLHYSFQEPCSDCPYPASRTCCEDINPASDLVFFDKTFDKFLESNEKDDKL